MTILHPYWFTFVIAVQSIAWVWFGRIIERKTAMLGDGISLFDLASLLKAIRDKDLTVQVKIVDGQWEDISKSVIIKMIAAVTSGSITHSNDIQLRLFDKR